MKEGLEKKLLLDLLMHPAEVLYKDDMIALIKPSGTDSLVYHLEIGTGKYRYNASPANTRLLKNDNDKYVVATYKGERILATTATPGWRQHIIQWVFSPYSTEERLIKKYPTLIDAFDKIASKINYLPLIKHHTKEVIAAAIKQDPANIRHVRNMTIKDKKYWLNHNSSTFEYMQQDKELVRYAMDYTDVGLGKIGSHFVTASIAKKGLRKNPSDLKYVPKQYQTPELVMYAINQDPSVLQQISHPTTEMYVAAVRAGKNGWDFVPDSLRKKVKKLA